MKSLTRRNGKLGVKQDGRSYGYLPLAALKQAGIAPSGKVQVLYIKPQHRKAGRFIFAFVAEESTVKDGVIRLTHDPGAKFSHFEVQKKFKLFEKMSQRDKLTVEVDGDEVHLIHPKRMRERSIFVEQEDDAHDNAPRSGINTVTGEDFAEQPSARMPITSGGMLAAFADLMKERLPRDAIVLISKSRKSLTVTIPKGNHVDRRWRVHVTEEVGDEES